jgi:RimJ/RimL family protein N-acetyltransferase
LPLLAGRNRVPGKGGEMDPHGISFRRLRASDLDLLHRWLNMPHVRRWWYAEGSSYAGIEEHYLPAIEGREATKPFVILYRGEPIGYVQSYPISAEDDEAYASLVDVEDSAGVDLFIGDPEYLYRGLGRHVIRRFLSEHVFSEPGIAVCVIGPEPNNTAAIRAYEKAGFRFFKTIQVPGEPEPEYLMRLSRREFEGDGLG